MKRLLYKYVLLLSLGLYLSSFRLQAQEGLQISTLFEKYGDRQNVTMVELNGKILKSYKMSKYRSLVFKDVTPYLAEIQKCLKHDKEQPGQVNKTQEVMEDGILRSAYYQLHPSDSKQRYIIFKLGKKNTATLVYIEGSLNEEELMNMLYKEQ